MRTNIPKFTLRIELEVDAPNQITAEKMVNNFTKELPFMEGVRLRRDKMSLYNVSTKAITEIK